MVAGQVGYGLNQFYSREISSLILMQHQYKYKFGPLRGPLPQLWNISETHIRNQNHCDETKLSGDLKHEQQKTTNHKTSSNGQRKL